MSTWQIERNARGLALEGDLRIADAVPIWQRLRELAANARAPLELDVTRATAIDGAIMSLLVDLRAELAGRGLRAEIVGAPEPLQPVIHLYRGDVAPQVRAPQVKPGAITAIGAATRRWIERSRQQVGFLGDLVAAVGRAVRGRARVDWRSLPVLIAQAGLDGVLIVVVLNFLLGFVMAFQTARYLDMYGANIYVADLVGISITRELAPLMTAIIIAGRSGAGYAAELGTMRVSDEIDALRTMGFAPMSYLVVPRMLALVIVAPVLTILGDVVGVAGGAVVASTTLDVPASAYLAELRDAVVPADIWTGLVKSVAFGAVIAFIGCQQGLGARGAASGVGRGTTATVVYCLFTLVVVDTLFTMLFRWWVP
jgi:phospholipid/cholesterol/gamma-HCH transport system permease protein